MAAKKFMAPLSIERSSTTTPSARTSPRPSTSRCSHRTRSRRCGWPTNAAIIDNPATAPADRETARDARSELQDHIERRNVGVYGAITLRSDGDAMEISFMLERPRGKQRWQGYRYVRDGGGEWVGI